MVEYAGMTRAQRSLVARGDAGSSPSEAGPCAGRGSAAAVADAKQTNLCAVLSAGLALVESRRTWTAESLADTCCA